MNVVKRKFLNFSFFHCHNTVDLSVIIYETSSYDLSWWPGQPQTLLQSLAYNTLLPRPIPCNRPFLLIAQDFVLQ